MRTDVIDPGVPATVAHELSDLFARELGRPAEGCFLAPGRVNLIGEHLDYNGGLCLPAALPHATYVAAARREDDRVTLRSLQTGPAWSGTVAEAGPGDVEGWVAYAAGVLWALAQDGFDLPGLDLVVDSRVPVGAGLSSSAALECAVALAACAAAGVSVDAGLPADLRERVVEACVRAENDVAGAATGGLDQRIAVHAQAGHALLLDFSSGEQQQVPWDPRAHGLALLVVDTRVHHQLNDGGYGSRRAQCEEAARLLGVSRLAELDDPEAGADLEPVLARRVRHVVTENRRVMRAVALLDDDQPEDVGELLTASHVSLRDDYEVSCEELDVVVETALDHGALGARMTGGGFGGSAIALVPEDAREHVASAVADAFAVRGWGEPGVLHATTAPGARRVL